MSKQLTLRDYQSQPIDLLFMAVIIEEFSPIERKQHMESLTPKDQDYWKIKDSEKFIDSKISKGAEELNLDPALAKQFAELLKGALPLCFVKSSIATIVLKNGNSYIDVTEDKEIDLSNHKLRMLEPFSRYYSKKEYRFIKVDGKVLLDVDSMEPFKKYTQKVKEKV